MGAQTCTDILQYISLIPVFGYFLPGTSISRAMVSERSIAMCMVLEGLPVGYTMAWLSINRYDARAENLQ